MSKLGVNNPIKQTLQHDLYFVTFDNYAKLEKKFFKIFESFHLEIVRGWTDMVKKEKSLTGCKDIDRVTFLRCISMKF